MLDGDRDGDRPPLRPCGNGGRAVINSAIDGWLFMKPVSVHPGAPATSQNPGSGPPVPDPGPTGGGVPPLVFMDTKSSSDISSGAMTGGPLIPPVGKSSHLIFLDSGFASRGNGAVLQISCIFHARVSTERVHFSQHLSSFEYFPYLCVYVCMCVYFKNYLGMLLAQYHFISSVHCRCKLSIQLSPPGWG